jgi:glycosyltransferase involved in cell wall biosynthesis
MRILMLAQFYPPIIGGEEQHVYNLSVELVTRGHEVAVVTIQHGQESLFTVEKGVRVYRVPSTMKRLQSLLGEKERYHAPPFPDPEILQALWYVIQRECPEIIHAHNWLLHSYTPLKAWSKAKFVVTLHDYSQICVTKRLMRQGQICETRTLHDCLRCAKRHYGIKGAVITLAHRGARELECKVVDMFIPVSQAVARGTQLAERRLQYRVIPNFVPDILTEICCATHPLLAQLPQGHFLLFVGDIVVDKGVEVLLNAYAQLECDIPLVLIGRTEKDLYLPPNTRLLGSWPHEAVLGAWQRCTLALVPSICPDSCPTVAIEAMSMGKPIIGSRIGGLTNIVVDNETGLLVTPGDSQELQAAIQCLLHDPQRRERMGRRAREYVTALQAQAVVTKIEQVYRELLEGSGTL